LWIGRWTYSQLPSERSFSTKNACVQTERDVMSLITCMCKVGSGSMLYERVGTSCERRVSTPACALFIMCRCSDRLHTDGVTHGMMRLQIQDRSIRSINTSDAKRNIR